MNDIIEHKLPCNDTAMQCSLSKCEFHKILSVFFLLLNWLVICKLTTETAEVWHMNTQQQQQTSISHDATKPTDPNSEM